MAINVSEETGESVYTEAPFEHRVATPLYRAVRELVVANTTTGKILDIGCSDGVATAGLDDLEVVGLDLNQRALIAAGNQNPGYLGVNASLLDLPFSKGSLSQFDTALFLDILEHVKRSDSILALRNIKTVLPDEHTVIVSMPIISPVSTETWREGLTVLAKRERPEMGLFDRTHEILTTARGHRRIFAAAGYVVAEEFNTNHLAGVTGNWSWKAVEIASTEQLLALVSTVSEKESIKAALLIGLRGLRKAYFLAHRTESSFAQAATEALVAYQGLYVLKPTKE